MDIIIFDVDAIICHDAPNIICKLFVFDFLI